MWPIAWNNTVIIDLYARGLLDLVFTRFDLLHVVVPDSPWSRHGPQLREARGRDQYQRLALARLACRPLTKALEKSNEPLR